MASTFIARHNLTIEENHREAGELVPEAATWKNRDHLLHVGKIRPTDVADEVFVAAVREYCPGLREQLEEINGLDFDDFPEQDDPEVGPLPDPPADVQLRETVLTHPDTIEAEHAEDRENTLLPKPPGEPSPAAGEKSDGGDEPKPAKKAAAKAPAKKAPAKKAPAKKAPAKKTE